MRGFLCSGALLVGLFAPPIVHAAPAGPPSSGGADALLAQGRSAWDRGDWRHVEALYKQALEAGGLTPNAALDAYVRLGSAESLLKRRDAALVAFRHAALLQPKFKVPHVAGSKGARLAALARKQEAKIGAFRLGAEVPANVAAGVPLQVTATLDPDHAAILSKVSVFASDSSATQVYRDTHPANTQVRFTLPGTVIASGATLTLRIDALDVHDNRMASVERLVHVAPELPLVAALGPVAVGPAVDKGKPSQAGAVTPAPKEAVQAPAVLVADVKPLDGSKAKKDDTSSHHGFWSTAWPWVLSGAALAAGGAVAYFATRPGDDVSVGAARIEAR